MHRTLGALKNDNPYAHRDVTVPTSKYPSHNDSMNRDRKPVSTSSSLVSYSNKVGNVPHDVPSQCVFCDSPGHKTWECDKYVTCEDRRQRMSGRCFSCMATNHRFGELWKKTYYQCIYCKVKGHHNCAICPKQFTSQTVRSYRSKSVNNNGRFIRSKQSGVPTVSLAQNPFVITPRFHKVFLIQ